MYGIELLQRDLVAVAFEQRANRGRGEPLAEGGNHATGDEDVLGLVTGMNVSTAVRLKPDTAIRSGSSLTTSCG